MIELKSLKEIVKHAVSEKWNVEIYEDHASRETSLYVGFKISINEYSLIADTSKTMDSIFDSVKEHLRGASLVSRELNRLDDEITKANIEKETIAKELDSIKKYKEKYELDYILAHGKQL